MKKVHTIIKGYLYMKANKTNAFFRTTKSPVVKSIDFPRFFRTTKSPVNKIKSYYKCIPENRKKRKKDMLLRNEKLPGSRERQF